MLKLQTGKDGKVDITFAEDSGIANGKIKRAALHASSSAGRRKSRELHDSHVFPKRTNQSRGSKAGDTKPQISHENVFHKKQESLNARKPTRQKQVVRTQSGKKKIKDNIAAHGSDNKVANKAATTDAGIITQSQLNTILQALKSGDENIMASITALQSAQQTENLQSRDQGIEKGKEHKKVEDELRGTNQAIGFEVSGYHRWSRQNKTSEANDKALNGLLQKPSETDVRISPNQKTQPHVLTSSFAIGAPGIVTYDHQQQMREKQKHWREELDEQVREKKRQLQNEKQLELSDSHRELNTARASQTSIQSQQATLLEPRHQPQPHPQPQTQLQPRFQAQPAAMASSFAIGAPGIVAYDLEETRRNKQRQYLLEIKEQIQQQEINKSLDNKESSRSLSLSHSQSSISSPQKELDSSGYFASTGNDVNRVSYGRRNFNPKDLSERDKLDRDREKHLQHQRAIQEQVEEKRRKKMEEREKKIQEELEEERKLALEREKLNRQHEDEIRKKREKEEAERQRLEALQERVREAYENAQRDKHESRIRKLKASGHDASKLEEKHGLHNVQSDKHNAPETHRESSLGQLDLRSISSVQEASLSSTRSTKENRPVVNWGSSPEDEKRLSRMSNDSKKLSKMSREGRITERGSRTHRDEDTKDTLSGEETRIHTEQSNQGKTRKKDREVKVKDRTAGKKNPKEERQKKKIDTAVIGTKVQRKEEKSKVTSAVDKEKEDNFYNDHFKIEEARKKVGEESVTESVVPYIRTTTMTLAPDVSEQRQDEDHGHASDPNNVLFDIQRTPTVQLQRDTTDVRELFTPRQQQILEQLQALRKGLMDKRKEHEKEALEY